jgi:hypothetical protein
MIAAGSLVLVHFANPTEKFWGLLLDLSVAGVAIRGLSLDSFDDWLSQVAHGEEPSLGLSTMFVPLFRLERIYLDERVGQVESYRNRFERRTGVTVEEYLGIADGPLPS